MTPIQVKASEAKQLERNLAGKGRRGTRMVAVEIAPGVMAHVSRDISEATLSALKQLAQAVMDMPDEELKEVELYADYLKSRQKRKVGRPRKVRR